MRTQATIQIGPSGQVAKVNLEAGSTAREALQAAWKDVQTLFDNTSGTVDWTKITIEIER